MNRKVISFKQTVFLSEQHALSKVFEVQSFGLDTSSQIILLLVYCLLDNTLFEVSP